MPSSDGPSPDALLSPAPRAQPRRVRIDRISPTDAMQLVSLGPVPAHLGAVLVLDAPPDLDVGALESAVATRLGGIRRLRQRLIDTPFGCGRPIWVDDPRADPRTHVHRVDLPPPGDEAAMLDAAIAAVTGPLPRSRPLWRAVLLTRLADEQVAVVVVLHHVLADGLGGLAVLADLADGAAATTTPGRAAEPSVAPSARPRPTRRDLLLDAVAGHLEALRRLPATVAGAWAGRTELGGGRVGLAPRCSLNAPTGPRRGLVCVETDLAPLKEAARRAGGTVNDAFLAVVGGAVSALLAHRGESVPDVVVSVSVAGRASASTGTLGNQVGVMPVRVPTHGPIATRLASIAATTRAQKVRSRGASAWFVVPLFRGLGRVGLARWFVDRQRLVSLFLTSLRGPAHRLTMGGLPVRRIVPVTGTAGNVSVTVAAISYAGTVTLAVTVDPDLVPDAAVLVAALRRELDLLVRVAVAGDERAGGIESAKDALTRSDAGSRGGDG